ncbi:hypothetical protein B6U96_11145 [Archaeoglobales archaeon ex4484_92]|nr:MAG: hypothetical protein B6U96_11145 [Archaeoglobales archaeon ex4484_92]
MNVNEFIRNANLAKDESKLRELIKVGEYILKHCGENEKGKVLGTLGNIHFQLKNFDEAEKYYLDALQFYINLSNEDLANIRFVSACLHNLGNLYQARKKYDEAIKSYSDALKTLEYSNDHQLRLSTLIALGTLHAKIGNLHECEENLREALEIAERIGDEDKFITVLNNLAFLYLKLKKKNEAKILLKKAMNLIDKGDFKAAPILQNLLNLVDDSEFNSIVVKLEKLNLPYDLKAKVNYIKAKRLERTDKDLAAENYIKAGCFSFLAYRVLGLQSVNFIYCFERAMTLSSSLYEDAKFLRDVIAKVYLGLNFDFNPRCKLAGALRDYIKSGKITIDEPISDVIRIVAGDARAELADLNANL